VPGNKEAATSEEMAAIFRRTARVFSCDYNTAKVLIPSTFWSGGRGEAVI
jgi:hypothetical protein